MIRIFMSGSECSIVFNIGEYSDIKICLCEKGLFGKVVLACEDEK